jgi:integrase
MSKKSRQRGSSIQRVELQSGIRWRFRLDLPPGPDGRRRQRTLTFETEAEAVEAQARARTQVTQQSYTEPSKITLNQYLDDWLAAGERTWRPTTCNSYRLALKPAREALGRKPLQRVTRADVERLARTMLTEGGRGGTGRSPRTVALLLTILGKAFGDAVDDDLLHRNVVERVRKPRSQHTEMHTWTAEQVRQFLAHVTDDPLIGLWHLTMRGLRRGEVMGLRWCDVDLDAGVVHVRQDRVQAGPQVVTGPPKTARGRRSIPLDTEAVAALRSTYQRTVGGSVVPLHQSGTPKRVDARLVAVDAAGEPLRPEVYGDAFTRHAQDAGLPNIRLHDARHTALSLLLEQGVPVHVVARFAGHDPSVTLRTYAHVSDTAMIAASTALGTLYETR